MENVCVAIVCGESELRNCRRQAKPTVSVLRECPGWTNLYARISQYVQIHSVVYYIVVAAENKNVSPTIADRAQCAVLFGLMAIPRAISSLVDLVFRQTRVAAEDLVP